MRNQCRLGGQSLKDVLGEVYLERASVSNPVFPNLIHHLLKGRWTTQEGCAKGVERASGWSDTRVWVASPFRTRHNTAIGAWRVFFMEKSRGTLKHILVVRGAVSTFVLDLARMMGTSEVL